MSTRAGSSSDGATAAGEVTWAPAAALRVLRLRAELLGRLRGFFAARGVLEVEPPLLVSATVTDPGIEGFQVPVKGAPRFLHTSPEHAMKRLLAAGSGDIYAVCRVFRRGETGSRHNPEFTLVEWYRTAMDHLDLMGEVAELAGLLLDRDPAWTRLSYAEAFAARLHLDPHGAPDEELRGRARELGLAFSSADGMDRDGLLDFLFAVGVQPHLGRDALEFVDRYPASQAALARVDGAGDHGVARRFELFLAGVELANGYHELTDAGEQRRRMERDRQVRRVRGLPEHAPDERLLGALEAGLPDCAGVAVGFDRLVMLRAGAAHIREVLAFPYELA